MLDSPLLDGISQMKLGPSAADMANAMAEMERQRFVRFSGFKSRTYWLGDSKQNAEYEQTMCILMVGLTKRTHMLVTDQRQFSVQSNGWMVHLEWIEYELISKGGDLTPMGGTTSAPDKLPDEIAPDIKLAGLTSLVEGLPTAEDERSLGSHA